MKALLTTITLASFAYASVATMQESYDKGDYNQTIIEAKKSKSEYSNPKLHLLWAKSAEALGDKDAAMSAYERVLMLDENSTQAKMALVKIYRDTSRDSMAEEMYEEIQTLELSQEELQSVEPISKIDFGTLKAQASAGVGYDSNINVSASADELDKFYGTTGSSAEESTLFIKTNASASYFNDLGSKGGHYIKAAAKFSYQKNIDANYFNMRVFGFDFGVGHKSTSYSCYMPISYDKIHYLSTDLLTQIKIAPKFTIPLRQDTLVDVNAKYASRSYDDSKYAMMADSSYGLGLGATYIFGKNYIYAKMNYELFSSDKTDHPDFLDKNMFSTHLGGKYNITPLYATSISYTYKALSYDDKTTTNKTREDDYSKFDLKLLYNYHENINFFASESFVSNSSNHVPATYTKNVLTLGVSASY